MALLLALFALGLGFAPQLGSFFSTLGLTVQQPSSEVVLNSPVPTPVQETPSPEPTLSPIPPSPLPSPTPSITQLPPESLIPQDPLVQPTATITRIPRVSESLIGINYLFKIHRVQQGENLILLANQYSTTVTAISTINYKFSTPIWVNQVIIIPVNQTDVSELPAFEAYRVLEDVSLEVLAGQLGVDPAEVQFYNGLGTSNQLSAGEWLVVPREKAPTE